MSSSRVRLAFSALLLGTWMTLPPAVAAAPAFAQSHALLGQVLSRHVAEGRVDYAALKKDPADLDRYLAQLSAVSKEELKSWDEPSQLAFLINAYNAWTLRLVATHYPVGSIKDIGTLVRGPWDQRVVNLWGETLSLDTLEHSVLRKDYKEPRIHFALVCAARSCPPLRSEPYLGEQLGRQLDDQARQFLATPSKNRVVAAGHTVHLSPIFKWYAADFERQSGSVLSALQPYWPADTAALLAKGQFSIRYTVYDWSLNDRKGR